MHTTEKNSFDKFWVAEFIVYASHSALNIDHLKKKKLPSITQFFILIILQKMVIQYKKFKVYEILEVNLKFS